MQVHVRDYSKLSQLSRRAPRRATFDPRVGSACTRCMQTAAAPWPGSALVAARCADGGVQRSGLQGFRARQKISLR